MAKKQSKVKPKSKGVMPSRRGMHNAIAKHWKKIKHKRLQEKKVNQSQSNLSKISYMMPNLKEMYPHQVQALKDKNRFQVLVWHRRARKTTTAIEKLKLQAHYKKAVYWLIFPTYNEAKEAVWKDPNMLFRIIPQDLIEKTNEMELTVYLKCGSIICLKGADTPERLLGAGPFGVVMDEFAEMKYETWSRVVQPIIRANGGWTWFIGTPKGKNHLYQHYLKGQEKNPEWKSWLLKASQSGVIPQEQLERAKKDMPAGLYNQEFECDFLEGAGAVFRNVKDVATAKPKEPVKDHIYVIGIDLAKHQDYTVLAVYDRATNAQVYQDRFQTIEWPFQKKRIIAVAKHYNHALVPLDATGIGDPIADDLLRAGVAVEPYKMTNQSKKDLVEKLSIWIEQKKIKILPIETTINELENFSYEIGLTGRVIYGAPEGFNDDTVIAHALAVWSLQPLYKDEKKEKVLTPIQRSFRKAVKEHVAEEEGEILEKDWREWMEEG